MTNKARETPLGIVLGLEAVLVLLALLALATAPSLSAAPGEDPGEQAYQRCVACHQANGKGMPGVFPPLAGSEYVKASNVAVPVRILVNGMSGPVTVAGTKFDGVMPPYGTGVPMSNAEAAAVLSYVRRSWGNGAGAVTAADVAREKAARKAKGPATAAELAPLM